MRVSPGPYSRLTGVLQKYDDGAEYIGPYISSFVVRQTVEEANKAFMLPTCGRKFPAEFGKGRPCRGLDFVCLEDPSGGRSGAERTDGRNREKLHFFVICSGIVQQFSAF